MKRWMVGIGLLAAVAAAGCGSKTKACAPVEGGVGVCVDGKAVTWSPGVLKPHMHENGGYYAGAEDLAQALGVKVEIATDKKSVTVGGTTVKAKVAGAKGIHEHEAKVFAPVKEFAEAAGYKADVDGEQHTVNLHK